MSNHFDPKKVLRQISHPLLRDLFEVHRHELDVPWESLKQAQIAEIFEAWQALGERDRRTIEIVLQDVHEMACEDGVKAIVEEAIRQDERELLADLEEYDSRYDKAVWTYIKARDVWESAVRFARADCMSHGRYWVKRIDLPQRKPDIGNDAIAELEKALSAFFVATQGRGRYCKVEHYRRACGADYFFAYLDDYADTYLNFDVEGDFVRVAERRAFETVFVYHAEHGALEVFARGGKRVIEPLQEIFCRILLAEEIGPEDRQSPPYDLNPLLSRFFQFPTDPEDGIESVRILRLRLAVKGMSRRRIVLEADPDAGPEDIYDMMERYLNQRHIPLSIVDVTQVGLKITFRDLGIGQPHSLSFQITHPNSCNLKSKPEQLRLIGEKYLIRWRLDRARNSETVVKAA